MKDIFKLMLSVLMVFAGFWFLLPHLPYIKPSSIIPSFFVWWPHIVSVVLGVVPIALLIFGGLLLWIEFDQLKSFKAGRSDESKENENEEMPSFEDVEYKDLECPECGEDFKTDIGLKVHRKVNHPDEFEENPEPNSDED